MVKENNLTWLLTISSARISLMVHPPPMRNEISLPTIRKQGEMSVPWGGSAPSGCCPAGASFSLGRFSAPPIHQSPCCWALSLLRAAGLSPNVGWWMKALPVISHSPIPSSKSKLQATLKTKKEKEKKPRNCHPQNILWLHSELSPLYSFVFNYHYRSMHQWFLKDIYNEIRYQCIQLDKCHCWNRDCCCMDSDQEKITAYYKYPCLVITYSQRNTVLLERWLLHAFWSIEDQNQLHFVNH